MGDWTLMRDSAVLTLMIFPTGPGFVCQIHSSIKQEGCHSILAYVFSH